MAGSPLQNVVVRSSKPGKAAPLNYLNIPDYNKADVDRWDSYRATVRDLSAAGKPLNYAGVPSEYLDLLPNLKREWQANKDWRAANYAILDFGTLFVPVPKVGMLRWLKYGGSTFQEAKVAIWAKNAKPFFQKIVNEETGQTFKVFAEIHHKYVPQRWGFPNWITNSRLNLQITNSIEHGLMDPFRHQFFPGWIKEGIKEGMISAESVFRIK